MSFSDLAGGASCGPSNPLQDLGKRFGHDRSHQLDRFASESGSSSPAAGSSRASGFRSSPRPGVQPSHQEAFPGHGPNQQLLDVASLRGALPSPLAAAPGRTDSFHSAPTQHDFEASFRGPGPSLQQPYQQLNARGSSSAWSNDFVNQHNAPQAQQQPAQGMGSRRQDHAPSAAASVYQSRMLAMPHQPHLTHHAAMGGGMYAQAGPAFMDTNYHAQHHAPAAQQARITELQASGVKDDDKVWTEAFTAYDTPAQAQGAEAQQVQPEQTQRPETDAFEADELARTAGRLVSTVEHDQNDKFKQSNFLNLMRKLRDREAGIQGTDIVETVSGVNTNTTASTLDKGKGKAIDATVQDGIATEAAPRTQQEAYQRRREVLKRMQGASQTGSDLRLPLERMQHEHNSNAEGREWLNELWAEEDARSEAIEAEARARQGEQSRQAFLGDGGDVAARMREDDSLEAREFAKYQNLGAGMMGAQSRLQSSWEEDMDEASREDFVGRKWEGTKGRGVPGAQAAEWDKLQSDWEAFEAGPSGLRVQSGTSQQRAEPPAAFAPQNVPPYEFQANNPYLHEMASSTSATTRNHSAHAMDASTLTSELDQQAAASADVQSILESEAAVQRDPTDSEAWYNLGVKQQENERETAAIAALHRAIQINPLMREAWLALAVSYTNENDRTATYESIERWIDSNEKYAGVVAAHRAAEAEAKAQQPAAAQAQAPRQQQHNRFHSVSSLSSDAAEDSVASALAERHQRLVGSLLAMARHGSQLGEVDADVQVALGILFNASDEHAKAVDCFGAAISVRPDDWLLYNRIGAVLSNGGRSDEAVQYYRYALELKPDFARCHFNLAISCLNLKSYNDAARHCYTALALQHAQAQAEAQARGDSAWQRAGAGAGAGAAAADPSQPLWETLRVSLELGNHADLAQKARMRDITVFDPVADFGGEGEGDMGDVGAAGDMDQSWAEANGNHPAASSVFHGLAGRE